MKTSKNNNSILLYVQKAFLLVILFCFTTTVNANFLKNLRSKIEKVTEKTEKEINKTFDSILNKSLNKQKNKITRKKQKNNPTKSKSATTYSFTHEYTMQIKDGKRTTTIDYYLTSSGNYFATRLLNKKKTNTTISVMDITQKTIHTLMDYSGNKTRISMKLNLNKSSNYIIDQTNIKITPTGTTKIIVGHKCKGYKVKGDTIEGIVWITENAGISFSKHIYKSDPTQTQDALFKKLTTGLTLEMDMIDTSRRKPKPIHMTCIRLKKSNTTIHMNTYKKLM